jgi:hypothetical protein
MTDPKIILRFFLGMVLAAVVISSAKQLTASLTAPETVIHVEINGTDFGSFDSISGLEALNADLDAEYATVSFKRDFVTDPSLYLWAKNNVSGREGLKNVHLVEKTASGEEVGRKVLQFCHPLTWSVETANSSFGGFSETVEIAVQSLSK